MTTDRISASSLTISQRVAAGLSVMAFGLLLIAGLLVELITLRWSHPTSFLFFLLLGGLLMALGIIIYLLTLVSAANKASAE